MVVEDGSEDEVAMGAVLVTESSDARSAAHRMTQVSIIARTKNFNRNTIVPSRYVPVWGQFAANYLVVADSDVPICNNPLR